MAMLKKKTRKAIRKSFKKVVNKHGPQVARHLATGLAAAATTYLSAGSKKSHKQLEKVAKSLPSGKKILRAVTEHIPFLAKQSHQSNGNGHRKANSAAKGRKRSKKHAAA